MVQLCADIVQKLQSLVQMSGHRVRIVVDIVFDCVVRKLWWKLWLRYCVRTNCGAEIGGYNGGPYFVRRNWKVETT